MFTRRALLIATLSLGLGFPAMAAEKLKVVASFSILGDFIKVVGGERVDVRVLVGPDGDAHVYTPNPSDAKDLAAAKLVVVNGLGFEGWMSRLVKASGFRGEPVVASKGVETIAFENTKSTDPHAWQSVANAKIYVANIRDALISADGGNRTAYEASAARYLDELNILENEVKTTIDTLPPESRTIITSHDAFGYFAAAYGLKLLAPQGISTDAEPSAREVAQLIQQIKREKVRAVFIENISDPRLITRIAKETGAQVGGALYSDALSAENGPAGTYIQMVRYNIKTLREALTKQD